LSSSNIFLSVGTSGLEPLTAKNIGHTALWKM